MLSDIPLSAVKNEPIPMKNGSFSVGAPLPGNELVSILEMLAKLKS
jgi:hypothetical protein